MKSKLSLAFTSLLFFSGLAFGQQAQVLRDLESKQPSTLSKDELKQLLPGAKMGRVTTIGNTQFWSNDPDGTFIISSDNRVPTPGASFSRASTAPGKWHISDDGRYCVLIEWKRVDTEEWCRYIIKTTDGFFATKSDKVGTEKVYKLGINSK